MNTSIDSAVADSISGMDVGILSSDYVEQLFDLYQNDASNVPAEWQSYFRSLQNGAGAPPVTSTSRPDRSFAAFPRPDSSPATIIPPVPPEAKAAESSSPLTSIPSEPAEAVAGHPLVGHGETNGAGNGEMPVTGNGHGMAMLPEQEGQATREPAEVVAASNRARELHNFTRKQEYVDLLIRNYRVRGHLIAKVDPLGIPRPMPPELEPQFWGLSDADFDRRFSTYSMAGANAQTLREVLQRLRNTYCGAISAQFMHIDDLDVRVWLQTKMEDSQNRLKLSRDEQIRILTRLTDAVIFEEFIRRKFVGAKSFSLEGAESLIPLLDMAIEKAGQQGIAVDRRGAWPTAGD